MSHAHRLYMETWCDTKLPESINRLSTTTHPSVEMPRQHPSRLSHTGGKQSSYFCHSPPILPNAKFRSNSSISGEPNWLAMLVIKGPRVCRKHVQVHAFPCNITWTALGSMKPLHELHQIRWRASHWSNPDSVHTIPISSSQLPSR